MPLAARVGDDHRCLQVKPVAHVGGPILEPGSRTVFIGATNAARVGDRALCAGGSHDVITTGEPTVLIGGQPAARLGDATDGGFITSGEPTVTIGPDARAESLRRAARDGLPFCAKETRRRRASVSPDE